MKQSLSPKDLLQFFIQVEEFKNVMRHSWTSNPNHQESTAEHSWMMTFMAIALAEFLPKKINLLQVLKLVLIHDLAEVITSDIPVFEISERQKNKHKNERLALEKLYKNLPQKLKAELISLWEEFEAKSTLEAKVAQALDKMEVIIQHNIADFSTWDQRDFDVHAFYRTEYFDFDSFLRQLRDEVELMSVKKIGESNNIYRIANQHKEKFKKIYQKILEDVPEAQATK